METKKALAIEQFLAEVNNELDTFTIKVHDKGFTMATGDTDKFIPVGLHIAFETLRERKKLFKMLIDNDETSLTYQQLETSLATLADLFAQVYYLRTNKTESN